MALITSISRIRQTWPQRVIGDWNASGGGLSTIQG
jgi:hypothetical protein